MKNQMIVKHFKFYFSILKKIGHRQMKQNFLKIEKLLKNQEQDSYQLKSLKKPCFGLVNCVKYVCKKLKV